jgi:putative flippase GtrA
MIEKIIDLIWDLFWRRLILRFKQFFLYCVGGGLAFVTDAGLLFVFTEYGHIWYLFSATLSFLISGVVNYSFQYFITFKGQGGELKKQAGIFLLVALVGLAINNSLLYLQVEVFGLWYMAAKAIAAVVVLIWNFFMNKRFTFKGNKVTSNK